MELSVEPCQLLPCRAVPHGESGYGIGLQETIWQVRVPLIQRKEMIHAASRRPQAIPKPNTVTIVVGSCVMQHSIIVNTSKKWNEERTGPSEFCKGPHLKLSHPFTGDVELSAYLLKRMRLGAFKAIAQTNEKVFPWHEQRTESRTDFLLQVFLIRALKRNLIDGFCLLVGEQRGKWDLLVRSIVRIVKRQRY